MSAKILWEKSEIKYKLSLVYVVLTHYKVHPVRITEEEAVLQDLITVIQENTDQGDHNTRQVHLDVSHPQGSIGAL